MTVLTLRAGCSGGGMLPAVQASRDLTGIERLTILIHGFNNTACAANRSFKAFLALDGVNAGDTQAAFGEVCELFWPGDSRVLNGASYPIEVPLSIQAGRRLAESLAGLARVTPLTLRLVCHSLGNRVALECLKHYASLPSAPPLRVEGSLLMAAAVLVNMIEDSTALLGPARQTGDSRVLYSGHDSVLHFAFPLGEFAAGEGFGTAVGRFGQPTPTVWHANRPMDPYGHGDYWGGGQTSEQVRTWLRLSTTRTLPVRTIASNPDVAAGRPPARTMPSRSVGAVPGSCDCSD